MWPSSNARSWQDIVRQKQTARTEALKTASTPVDSHIVYLSASRIAPEIPRRIASGEWTASEVLEAYISQAAVAHATTNCITEVLFEEARREAHALDQYFQEQKQLKGPLHGVPDLLGPSIVNIKGYDSTVGHTQNADRPASTDAEVVKLVRQAGGIPLAKTNISQCMMFFECVNPIWGRSLNPFSKHHTCGGSTGGEGALLAMDGSALGWGTDVGGSLRIPASYCGIYSFKPGNGRVGTMGAVGMLFLVFKNLDERLILGIDCIPGFEAVRTVCGPMGRSVEDLELACRVVFGLSSQNYGPAPLPFRAHELPERLKFGYYTSDNFIKPSPVCQRAVLQTVEALRREGHECIEFTVPEPSKPMELFLALISSDGNKTLFAPIGPDPQQAELATVALGPKLYGWLRSFAAWFIERSFDDRICANLLRASRKKSVDDFWRICSEAKEYARMFNQEVWEKHQFDGIIAPVQAMPALPHESVAYVGSLSCPTVLYNIVDSPVGTIPVTRVDPVLDSLTEEWSNPKVGTGHGSPLVERLLYRGEGAMYNAQKMAGLPVGVQVVGKKWEEEKVIEMMKVVDRVLGQRGFGPGCWSSQKQ